MDDMKTPLSDEEMACLVDGLGTPEQLAGWRARLARSKRMRDEMADLSELASTPPGAAEPFVVDRYLNRYFPAQAFQGIWLKVKSKALELVEAGGWAVPAIDFRSENPPAGVVALSRSFDNLSVDFHVERISDDTFNITVQVKDLMRAGAPTMKVTLRRQGDLVSSQFLESDRALFREVRPGEYTVHVSNPQAEVLKVDIKMEP